MADAWSLTVEVPASDLVRRKGKLVKRVLGIPALHNLRGPWNQHHVVKMHKALLDAAHLARGTGAAHVVAQRLRHAGSSGHGKGFDALLIRRAPRPLDCAIMLGDWQNRGRGIGGDNLSSSLKAARDWTAKRVFGLDGDSNQLLRWHVGQERSARPKLYQISVLILPAAERWYELPDRWLRGEISWL